MDVRARWLYNDAEDRGCNNGTRADRQNGMGRAKVITEKDISRTCTNSRAMRGGGVKERKIKRNTIERIVKQESLCAPFTVAQNPRWEGNGGHGKH